MTNEMIMQEQLEEVLLIMAEKALIPYKDGNQWCILLGENIQEGICGFGDTIIDAMMDFYKEATVEGIIRKDDKIIEDTISYLNGGMCFNNSMEELKYRSNLAYGLKSLRSHYYRDITMTEAYKMGKEAGEASRWKPSEEQMKALKDAVRLFKETHFEKFHYKIESLYEQLKKLM